MSTTPPPNLIDWGKDRTGGPLPAITPSGLPGTPSTGPGTQFPSDPAALGYLPGGASSGSSIPGAPGSTGGTGSSTGSGSSSSTQNAIDLIRALYPWIDQLGLMADLQRWATDPALTPEMIVAEIRATPQWGNYFQGIRNPDGTLKMNEAQYLNTKMDYQKLLTQYGRPDYEYNDPGDFKAFFDNNIDPNELKQRLDTYQDIATGGQDVKNAFYVYAGMNLSNDDLYLMAVNPVEAQKYTDEYNAKVAASPLDYQTWITRATSAGLSTITSTLSQLQSQGVDTGDAIHSITNLNPDFARQMMDQLYHGGNPQGPFLNLNELLNSFQYALIGGAATQNGLALPSQEQAALFRQAGIDRAKALEGYSQIAQNQALWQGELSRSGRATWSQGDYEKAIFLQNGAAQQQLEQAQSAEKSGGFHSGAATIGTDRGGQVVQPGLQTIGA